MGHSNAIEQVADGSRRAFLYKSTVAVGVVGIASAAWPFIDSLNPAGDSPGLYDTKVDISDIQVGQSSTIRWRAKPVFIRHRTQIEIEAARNVEMSDLWVPEHDSDRVHRAEWLVVIGICVRGFCMPFGQKEYEPRGEYGGWFCNCCGSHYDTSGRIRRGPVAGNLRVPPHEILDGPTLAFLTGQKRPRDRL